MAESMGESVLGKASDLYDEYASNCQPCFAQGKGDLPATRFCIDCQVYLCDNCSIYHNALKATENHVLVMTKEAKKKAPPIENKDKSSLKCTVHKDNTVKYFCVSHAYLGCSVCITMNHKQCTNVDYIPMVAEDIRNHDDFKNFDEQLKALKSAYKTGISDVEKKLKTIEADGRQMKEAIQQFRKQLNDALDNYEKELTVKSGTINCEETKKLNLLSKKLATSLANVDSLAKKVDNLLSSDKNCETYVLMKTESGQLVSLEKQLTKAVQDVSCRRYEFHPNKEVLDSVNLGKLDIRSENVRFSAAMTALLYKDGLSLMKVLKEGTRVRRGKDWNRGNEDGGGMGTIICPRQYRVGRYTVQWDNGLIGSYRMGAQHAYDLETV